MMCTRDFCYSHILFSKYTLAAAAPTSEWKQTGRLRTAFRGGTHRSDSPSARICVYGMSKTRLTPRCSRSRWTSDAIAAGMTVMEPPTSRPVTAPLAHVTPFHSSTHGSEPACQHRPPASTSAKSVSAELSRYGAQDEDEHQLADVVTPACPTHIVACGLASQNAKSAAISSALAGWLVSVCPAAPGARPAAARKSAALLKRMGGFAKRPGEADAPEVQ